MTADEKLIDVAVPLPLEGPFTYRVPAELASSATFGRRALVPFRNKIRAGFIVGFPAEAANDAELKVVEDIPEEPPYLTPELWDFIRWTAAYYLIPTGLVLKTALPPGSDRKSKPWAILTPEGRRWFGGFGGSDGAALPTKFLKSEVMALRELREAVGEGRLKEALDRRWIRIEERIARPRLSLRKRKLPELLNPAGAESLEREEPPHLTEEQARAHAAISGALHAEGYNPFLLFGVTGSGKTEVYLRAIEDVIALSKRALVLVPEIALTPQLAGRFLRRFGGGAALFHSGLTPSQRLDEWRRIRSGEVNIVIAARSGIFAPLPDLGLIIVDEEHDPSYKQEDSCAYNARDMALARAKLENAAVVLGSATPSFESFVNAKLGKLVRLDLTARHHGGKLPKVELIDLRATKPYAGAGAFLTQPLIAAIRETLDKKEQTVIFLNRRGFDTFAQCRSCGHVFKCPNCDVSLTHHKKPKDLRCHMCGYSQAAAALCPQCRGTDLFFGGVGAQKVEEALGATFPDARIERLDRDSTRQRNALEDILERFRNREIDILCGTQMIVKGHDFPGISLVGVLCGDHSLHFPDFRASERTFQLIAQVAGRTGRERDSGRVVLQTFDPDHEAIRQASLHAYEQFFQGEAEIREDLFYPPYGSLILIRVEGNVENRVEDQALRIGREARLLKEDFPGVMILGPAPAPRKKVIGRHRRQILFKAASRAAVRGLVKALMERGALKAHGVKITVDVDPVDML